jgi:membrane-associated phospholipid phosphatase
MKRTRLSLSILVFTFLATTAFAQPKNSPYKMHAVLDFPIVGISGLGSAGARFLQRQVEPLSGVEISDLSTANIPQFDLSAHSQWSPTADKVSTFGTYAAMLTPGLLLFSPDINRDDWGTIILLSAETFAMTDFAVQMTKVQALRPRPYLYNPDITIPNELLLNREHRFSMLSGSTAYSAAMSFAAASMFADYHPKSKYKPYVWIAAAVIPATVGYLRYRSGMHYPSDVLVGYAVGMGVGLAVPYIHKKAKVWFR